MIDYTAYQIGHCYLCGSQHVYPENFRRYGGLVCLPCGEALVNQHKGGLSFFWYWEWLEAYGLRA